MSRRRTSPIDQILNEMDNMNIGGAMAMHSPPPLMTINQTPYSYGSSDEEEEFSSEDLQLAQDFITHMGGIERAINLLNKVEDCEECLGLADDSDVEADIDLIASVMPEMPDMPTMRGMM